MSQLHQMEMNGHGESRAAPLRAGAGAVFATMALLLAACSEPRQNTVATAEPTEVTVARPAMPSALAAMLPALGDETARLRPAFGNRVAETPLRMALTVLDDHVVANQAANVSSALGEARGLLEGYRLGSDGSHEAYVLHSAATDSSVADSSGESTNPEEGVDVSELDALDLLLMAIEEAMLADSAASPDQPAPTNANKENGGTS